VPKEGASPALNVSVEPNLKPVFSTGLLAKIEVGSVDFEPKSEAPGWEVVAPNLIGVLGFHVLFCG
jgi:hypothetical protein